MKRIIAIGLVLAIMISMVPALSSTVQAATMYSWPVPSVKTITQAYKGESSHGGIDIGGGSKNVYAICDGTVYARYTGCNNYSGGSSGKCMNKDVCTGKINTNTSNVS